MHRLVIIAMTAAVMFGCNKNDSYDPNHYFSPEQQASIIRQSVRYSAKMPPQATHETKFDSTFNDYYAVAFKEYDLRAVFPDSGRYYFLMTRKARSLWPAREGLGGSIKLDASGKLIDYDEVFRTWKMVDDSLKTHGALLFDLMVKKKDLYPYRSKFKGDQYIEFPDDQHSYDNNRNRWTDNILDSLQVATPTEAK